MKKIKLFCLPYAGGSAMVYNRWREYTDPAIEIVPVELAGRGARMNEPFYADIRHAAHDVKHFIKKEAAGGSYALFGHSMGGLIAYLVARELEDQEFPPAAHLFISGTGAPHIARNDKKYHVMEEGEFRKEVLSLGGTPTELFEYPELLELFLPLLRNDFRLVEQYVPAEVIRPLEKEITILFGKDDDLKPDECDGWKMHTTQVCRMYHFAGGHFFIQDEMEKITHLINTTLCHSPILQQY
ncbi:MAG TPA: alpha/beta fold hydrolase [Puia sp.]|jgi:surfactin synthase thioesterase subunit|nr:alpha/beta fold hydrolase [Puia sp.]